MVRHVELARNDKSRSRIRMSAPSPELIDLVTGAQFYLSQKYPHAQRGDLAVYRGAEFTRAATAGAMRWRFEGYVEDESGRKVTQS